jgi:ferredoxin-thioredoxin reductase catalytic subunit
MDAKELYEILRKIQEPKGNFFNKDMDLTMSLLEGLLENKERYGYMACPCRLASGTFEDDKDIVCPCVYREPDMKEYGACFCGLYVVPDWAEREGEHEPVPERRPPDKIKW